MKKNVGTFMVAILIFVTTLSVQGAVRLPAILGSHMVLKQQSDVKLWGWCNSSEKITVKTSWDTVTYRTTGSRKANWILSIKTPKAGGPYSITINNSTILEDVMIGEVWVCSGQSNMEWSGDQNLKQSLDEMPNATNTKIRFFYIPKTTADYPQDNCAGSWKVCTPEEMKHFSAVGYFFGKNLQKSLGAPIGLINSNWGGTPAEVWTSKAAVESNPKLVEDAKKLEKTEWWPDEMGVAYHAMIYPLINMTISGVIWYQGESNVGTYNNYKTLMTAMIEGWRKDWKIDFPFYFVQIAPFTGYGKSSKGALLREAQTNCLTIPKTGMAVIWDLVDDVKNIHPVNKIDVSARLANMALSETYGIKGLDYQFPMYKGMEVEKKKIRLHFDHAEQGLMSKGKTVTELYIAGEDKNFVPALSKIEGNTLLVWAKTVPSPVAVRFGFSNAAIPNLFSKSGLPVNTFRTDNWDLSTLSEK